MLTQSSLCTTPLQSCPTVTGTPPPGTPPSQTSQTLALVPTCTTEDLSNVKKKPFSDLKENIAREKLSSDEIVEAARSNETKSEESDRILENYEEYEHYEYNCEFEDYSDGEELFFT